MPQLQLRQIAEGLRFPEGPIAMADDSLVLVEIARGTLSLITPQGACHVIADLGGGPNGAAVGPDGAVYVCNNGGFEWHERGGRLFPGDRPKDYETGRIERVDVKTGKVDRLYAACEGHRLNGPNDIVFDREGGFYFTDFGKTYDRVQDRGAVYYARPDGSSIKQVLFPTERPNGIGLSPDESVLYVAETMTRTVFGYGIAAPGELTGKRHPAVAPAGVQFFDSMAVDGEGHVCVATIGAVGGITRGAPDGSASDLFATDDSLTTNICFGGPGLRTAYITLSSTGRLAAADWVCPGLPLNFLNV